MHAARNTSAAALRRLFRICCLGCLVASCGGASRPEQFDLPHAFYSFESGLEGWEARAIDTAIGTGEIAWSISPSAERASDRTQSLQIFLENINDAAKVFVQRSFQVSPGAHSVTIGFQLATSDGEAGTFTIIAGAFAAPPATLTDLRPAFRESTWNGADTLVGYRWVAKRYTQEVQVDSTGNLFVVVGVWGTLEVGRTYYLDAVTIDLD